MTFGTTFNTAQCSIKGADERWYRVPGAVLDRHKTLVNLASINVEELKRALAENPPGKLRKDLDADLRVSDEMLMMACAELKRLNFEMPVDILRSVLHRAINGK